MMLKIKRVPTLVSNFQKDEADEIAARGAGCGRNCLRNCCLPGTVYSLFPIVCSSKADLAEY